VGKGSRKAYLLQLGEKRWVVEEMRQGPASGAGEELLHIGEHFWMRGESPQVTETGPHLNGARGGKKAERETIGFGLAMKNAEGERGIKNKWVESTNFLGGVLMISRSPYEGRREILSGSISRSDSVTVWEHCRGEDPHPIKRVKDHD